MRKTILLSGMLMRSLIRRPKWPICLAACAAIVLACYWGKHITEPALAVHMTAYGQLLLTLVLLLFGLQIESEPGRISLTETISAYSRRTHTFLLCKWLTVMLVSLLLTALFAGFVYFGTLMQTNAPWTKQVLLHIVLLYFLPLCISGSAGILFARIFPSRNAYFFAFLFWFCTSSLMADYAETFAALGLSGGTMAQAMLNLGVANMRQISGAVMAQPVELPRFVVRIAMLLAICALCVGCGNFRRQDISRWKGRLYLGASLAFCAALCVLCVARYGTFFSRFADPAARQAYAMEKFEQYQPGQSVSLNAFPTEKRLALEEAEIAFHASTQGISVRVEYVARATQAIEAQSFTLYSDLQVDGVWVDGIAAPFERSHDGLLVCFPQPKAQGESLTICFDYHGYSLPLYPANETTVQLHRSFPWLPWPGLRSALQYENFYGYEQTEAFFAEPWQRADSVHYTLYYHGPDDLYTNLRSEGENVYTGTCTGGVSLYSGMVRSTQRGVEVYVPASQYTFAAGAADAVLDSFAPIADLCQWLGAARMPEPVRTVCVLEMDAPIILGYPFSTCSEIYSWGDNWEIWQSSGSSAIAMRRLYGTDASAYQQSPDGTGAAVAFVVSPGSGYPADAPHSSTVSFACWLYSYLRLRSEAEPDCEIYLSAIYDRCTGQGVDYIAGEKVPETPASEEAYARIEEIVQAMAKGTDFDGAFRALYQRLLQEERISPDEMISTLYDAI